VRVDPGNQSDYVIADNRGSGNGLGNVSAPSGPGQIVRDNS
jgi:hypothetical protein